MPRAVAVGLERETLADELRLIRKCGYAVSNEEQRVGAVSIAARKAVSGGRRKSRHD